MTKLRLWPQVVTGALVIILNFLVNNSSVLASSPIVDDLWSNLLSPKRLLTQETLNLSNRHPNSFINEVFSYNILLTLFYLRNGAPQPVYRDEIRKPFHYELTLSPGDLFAFHEDLMEIFLNTKVITTSAHFGASEGFRNRQKPVVFVFDYDADRLKLKIVETETILIDNN